MQKIRLIFYNYQFREIMRRSFMIWSFLLTCGIVLASTASYGQKELDKTIQVDFDNLPLEKVFEQLQSTYLIPLAYNNDASFLSKTVDYSGRKPAKKILLDILSRFDLTYELKHDYVRIIKKPSRSVTSAPQQQHEITGIVRNTTGEPLAGVSITIKDQTSIGTTTDLNGKFILSVPENAIIVVNIVGYRTLEIPVGQQKNFQIDLEETE
ncbi:MAG: carboxypeptidase-like regulatory domain-containing protein, partial [Sphingobacterium sp.]